MFNSIGAWGNRKDSVSLRQLLECVQTSIYNADQTSRKSQKKSFDDYNFISHGDEFPREPKMCSYFLRSPLRLAVTVDNGEVIAVESNKYHEITGDISVQIFVIDPKGSGSGAVVDYRRINDLEKYEEIESTKMFDLSHISPFIIQNRGKEYSDETYALLIDISSIMEIPIATTTNYNDIGIVSAKIKLTTGINHINECSNLKELILNLHPSQEDSRMELELEFKREERCPEGRERLNEKMFT